MAKVLCITSLGHSTDIGLQLGKACYPHVVISSVFSLSFLFLFLPCPSNVSSTISSISFLSFSER